MPFATARYVPTRRRWLLIGRALDERGRLRGLSFCWVRGGWMFCYIQPHKGRSNT